MELGGRTPSGRTSAGADLRPGAPFVGFLPPATGPVGRAATPLKGWDLEGMVFEAETGTVFDAATGPAFDATADAVFEAAAGAVFDTAGCAVLDAEAGADFGAGARFELVVADDFFAAFAGFLGVAAALLLPALVLRGVAIVSTSVPIGPETVIMQLRRAGGPPRSPDG